MDPYFILQDQVNFICKIRSLCHLGVAQLVHRHIEALYGSSHLVCGPALWGGHYHCLSVLDEEMWLRELCNVTD